VNEISKVGKMNFSYLLASSRTLPSTTFTTPFGNLTSSEISAIQIVVKGVISLGFITIVWQLEQKLASVKLVTTGNSKGVI
jgi:hypothetical protein